MYNGHKNWNNWNNWSVSLWINNDEGLYNLARKYVKFNTKKEAASKLLDDLKMFGITHTPDGAPYTISSIRKALAGI